MRRNLIGFLIGALALGLPVSAPAAAGTTGPLSDTATRSSQLGTADQKIAKTIQRRGHHHSRRGHHHYRDRYHRSGPRYYDRGRYGRGYYGQSRYQTNRCWREQRHSHFHGRPALVSVRVCRNAYGQTYVVHGETRLIHYVHRQYY